MLGEYKSSDSVLPPTETDWSAGDAVPDLLLLLLGIGARQ